MIAPHREDGPAGAVANALTVELEDHAGRGAGLADAAGRLLDVLAAGGAGATFLVVGEVAGREPDLVRAARAAGHEVGCHGHRHRPVGDQTPAEFRADLRAGHDALQGLTGTAVTAYRAPDFSVTPACRWALDVLAEEGFRVDASIDPARHDRSGTLATPREPYPIRRPAGTLWEFPPPVWRCLAGARFDRYPLTRHGLRAANAAGRPFTVNVHAWEFDGERRARAEPRLTQLLADFAFAPLSETLARWWERRACAAPRTAA
jgi:peptidoglycan/xylan/chitin deacetylase (PgdA/CDA1 family)